uniref:Nonstructural protein n=1 Tax=Dulem virus 199 TaxID=3145676 RepID=A0AAU8AXP9_9VIRU
MYLFGIYDERSRSMAGVFLDQTVDSAKRQFINSVANSEFICKFPDGFSLRCLGTIDELGLGDLYMTAEEALLYMENSIKKNSLLNSSGANNILTSSSNETPEGALV